MHSQEFRNRFWNIEPEKQSKSEEIYITESIIYVESYLDQDQQHG